MSLVLKELVFEAAQRKLEQALSITQLTVDEKKEAGGLLIDEESGREEKMESKHIELMQESEQYKQRLIEQKEALELFDELSALNHDGVFVAEAGSVVLASPINFLLGLAIPEFEVDSRRFIGVSLDAPIGQLLVGASAGQTISFNDVEYLIEAVL